MSLVPEIEEGELRELAAVVVDGLVLLVPVHRQTDACPELLEGLLVLDRQLLTDLDERIRALAQNPRGGLYFSTDSGSIYVIKPAD